MPTKKPRNYSKEYAQYHSRPDQKARRAARGRARYKMAKAGLVKKGDGKEVDHINMNPLNNSTANLKILPSSINRRKQPATKTRRK
jgi:hypothetical protein